MKVKYFFITGILLLTFSCTSDDEKDSYISNLEKLVRRLEINDKLNETQLDTINKNYLQLQSEFYQIKDKLNNKELTKVDSLQSQYNKAFQKQTCNELIDGIQDMFKMVKGIEEGFTTENK